MSSWQSDTWIIRRKVRNTVEYCQSSTWKAVHHGMYSSGRTDRRQLDRELCSAELESRQIAGKTGTAQLEHICMPTMRTLCHMHRIKILKISVTCVIPNGYASSNAVHRRQEMYINITLARTKRKYPVSVKMPEISTQRIRIKRIVMMQNGGEYE